MFNVPVYLFVSYSAEATYRRNWRAYNFPPDQDKDGGFAALMVSSGDGAFGLYFHVDALTDKLIAHETLHLTKAILKHIGHKHCRVCDNDEVDAHLCGYLHAWVKRKLKAARIRVT